LRASVGQPSVRAYLDEGAVVAGEVQDLLRRLGRPLATFESLCDLASGPGKVLLALDAPTPARLSAIDVNRPAIEWLRRRRPDVDARAEPPLPPTSFPPEAFDLVLSISLFTHLDESSHLAWVSEVARLLRPGGLGLITVHGETAYEGFRAGNRLGISAAQLAALRARAPLEDEGFVFEPEPRPEQRIPGVATGWGLAFHSHRYIRERWSPHLLVKQILPAALNFRQDAVVVSGH
jgi:SAM-dependent methyltransferase